MTFTVTITGDATPYEVYGGLTAATHYLLAKIGDAGAAWRGLSADDKSRVLISATRFIDAQVWQGTPTTPAVGGTTLMWPRAGVLDINGNAVDSSTVPTNVVNAAFELAAIFADDPDIEGQRDAGSNVRSVKAGSAGVDFFVPTGAQDGSASVFPEIVERLIGQYLASGDVTASIATGTTGVSQFDCCKTCNTSPCTCNSFNRSWPF